MSVRVINNTPIVKKRLRENYKKALIAIGLLVEREAKRKAPVDMGLLRADISFETDADKVRIGNTKQYAVYVEKGTGIYAEDGKGRKTPWVYFYDGGKGDKGFRLTRGQKPQPYLTPAGEENIGKIIDIVAKYMKRVAM